MASVESRHYYRFQYLRSEHWSNLRLEKMASVDAVCDICGLRDLSNDVHHLRYRKLFDVELEDLVVLCRSCHDSVHEALREFRDSLQTCSPSKVWKNTRKFARLVQSNDHAKRKRVARLAMGFRNPKTKPLFLALRQIRFWGYSLPPKTATPKKQIPQRNDSKRDDRSEHFQELGDLYRELRKQGAFGFVLVTE